MKRKPIRVDWEELEAAFDSGNEELVYYLDSVTGHVLLEGAGRQGSLVAGPLRLGVGVRLQDVQQPAPGRIRRAAYPAPQLPGRAADRIAPEAAAEILLERAGENPLFDTWTLIDSPPAQRAVTSLLQRDRRSDWRVG